MEENKVNRFDPEVGMVFRGQAPPQGDGGDHRGGRLLHHAGAA